MSTIKQLLEKNIPFTPAVVGFVIDEKQNKVLLGYREKVSNSMGQGLYAGLGGKARDSKEIEHETDEEAIIRELYEESGIEVDLDNLESKGCVKFLFTHKPEWNLDVRIYVIKKWIGEPHKTVENKILPEWRSINDIPLEQMWEDAKYWLSRVIRGEVINEAYLYNEGLKLKEIYIL